MRYFKFDWFMKGMLIAVALGFAWPAPGAQGGFLQPEWLNRIGVALVFFLNGLGLSVAAMRDGALRWRAHLLIQSCTFVLFPLLGVVILALTKNWLSPELQLGFFYLCALPSTVSSSVARRVLPSGPALKSLAGTTTDAPLAKVNLTANLFDSPVQMMPSCDQTGAPIHCHSSTTFDAASLISWRLRLKVCPRQSPRSAIFLSISDDGEGPSAAAGFCFD